MSARFARLRSPRGVSLIVATGLMLITLLLAAAAMRLVLSFTHSASRAEQANTAFFAAEGGVEQALYEISARKDGYEFANTSVCGVAANPNQTTAFNAACAANTKERFLSFLPDSAHTYLSRGRGFWQLFARTLADPLDATKYVIPNPYFVGNKDGNLQLDNAEHENEWGVLSKQRPLALALQRDNGDGTFTKLSTGIDGKVFLMVNPKDSFNTASGTSTAEPLLTWIFSAVDSSNVEHTLQGVIQENDFQSCDENGYNPTGLRMCFELPLRDSSAGAGSALAGQDINRNIGSTQTTPGVNRVSGLNETYDWNTSSEFMADFNSADWHDGRLSISLIGTPSETSGAASNTLRYKVVANEVLPDEYTYIIAEGFAGPVKQTIETRYRRQTTLPIFSYVIFQ